MKEEIKKRGAQIGNSNARKNEKDRKIIKQETVYFPEEDLKRYKEIAGTKGITLNKLVNEALNKWKI